MQRINILLKLKQKCSFFPFRNSAWNLKFFDNIFVILDFQVIQLKFNHIIQQKDDFLPHLVLMRNDHWSTTAFFSPKLYHIEWYSMANPNHVDIGYSLVFHFPYYLYYTLSILNLPITKQNYMSLMTALLNSLFVCNIQKWLCDLSPTKVCSKSFYSLNRILDSLMRIFLAFLIHSLVKSTETNDI